MATTPRPPASLLLRIPFLYPLAGIAFVLTKPALLVAVLLRAAGLLLSFPVVFFSTAIARRATHRTFRAVLASRGVNGGLRAASAEDRAALAARAPAVARGAAPPTLGVRALLVALFTPAAPGWPWYWRWAKNLVAAPLAAVFPAGRALAAMADPADVALRALEPYLDAKGLVKGGRERAGLAVAKRGELIAFGVAAAAISALPIVSWVTMFTTAAGAALWAADLEAAGRLAR